MAHFISDNSERTEFPVIQTDSHTIHRTEFPVVQTEFHTTNTIPVVQTDFHTTHHTIHRQFVEMKYGPVYIFGVAAGNSSAGLPWDVIQIYGGVDRSIYNEPSIRCCLAYKESGNVKVIKTRPFKVRGFFRASSIRSIHVTCFNKRHQQNIIPVGAALGFDKCNCSENEVRYVSPYFPLRETVEKVVIGTKTAYGNVSAEQIIGMFI